LGIANFVGTFGSLGKWKTSIFANGTFASTFATQGPTFGEPTKKKKKKQLLRKCSKKNGLPNFLRVELVVDPTSKILAWCTTRFVPWLKVGKTLKS
jgi:hypothetical protein